MSTTADKIAVMQAFERGEPIQIINKGATDAKLWHDIKYSAWNWGVYSYRIKPKMREWWIYDHPDVGTVACKSQPLFDTEYIHVREVPKP